MKTCTLSPAGLIVLSLWLSVSGGDDESGRGESKGVMVRQADKIYNDIMATLPLDMKAKIDSSCSARGTLKAPSGSSVSDSAKQAGERHESARLKRQHYLQEFPEEVRLQVEKAISDMEGRQKERALEFKEIKREH